MRFTTLIASIVISSTSPGSWGQTSPVDLVNPLIGTAGEGQTFPGVGEPFAMTAWTSKLSQCHRSGRGLCSRPPLRRLLVLSVRPQRQVLLHHRSHPVSIHLLCPSGYSRPDYMAWWPKLLYQQTGPSLSGRSLRSRQRTEPSDRLSPLLCGLRLEDPGTCPPHNDHQLRGPTRRSGWQ